MNDKKITVLQAYDYKGESEVQAYLTRILSNPEV